MTIKRYLIFLAIVSIMLIQACSKLIYPVYPIPDYTGTIEWEEVSQEAGWTGRWDHAAVSFHGKIWILGGYNPGNTKSDSYLEDVWNSSNGESRELINASAPWHGRRGHAVVVFDDGDGESIFLIGGYSVDEQTGFRQYNNDVWNSSDGISWVQIKANSIPGRTSKNDWSPRFNHRCEVFSYQGKSYIYLIAGRGTYGSHDEGGAHLDKPVYQWQELWSSADGINWEAENDELKFPQSYLYRTQHQIIHYADFIWGFPGKNSTSVYFSNSPDTYSIWKFDSHGNWSVDSEGPPFMPVYGYALVLHDNKIWILGGHTANHGPSNAVWSGNL